MQMQSRLYVNKHTVCVQDTMFAGNSHHVTGAELDFHHVCQQRQWRQFMQPVKESQEQAEGSTAL